MLRPRRGALVATAIVTVLAAGCGDDTSSAPTTAAAAAGSSVPAEASSETVRSPGRSPDRPIVLVDPTATLAAEPTESTLTSVVDRPELCEPMLSIARMNGELTEALGSSADWEEVRDAIVEVMTPRVEDYRAVAEHLVDDPDLAASVEQLARFTDGMISRAEQAPSAQAYYETLRAAPNLSQIEAAGRRLDTFSRAECGFGTN